MRRSFTPFLFLAFLVVGLTVGENVASAAPVGGPRSYTRFYNPGRLRSGTFDLVGVGTSLTVRTFGPRVRVSVRGAISGLNYGDFIVRPGQPLLRTIRHLPYAKLRFSVQNIDGFSGTVTFQID